MVGCADESCECLGLGSRDPRASGADGTAATGTGRGSASSPSSSSSPTPSDPVSRVVACSNFCRFFSFFFSFLSFFLFLLCAFIAATSSSTLALPRLLDGGGREERLNPALVVDPFGGGRSNNEEMTGEGEAEGEAGVETGTVEEAR